MVSIRSHQIIGGKGANGKSGFIGLCVPDKLLEEINRELKNKKSYADDKVRSVLDFSRIKLKRIFNNSSFEQGGRFYHGWWQEIPSGYRKDIRINDICTCEIDFCGYHVNLLYALKKLPLPVDDVYTLDGFPPKSRDLLKTAVQILLNVDDEDKALSTFRKKFPRSKHPEVFTCNTITHERIIEAFKEKHKAIAKCFCRDYGIKIQFIDAEIAARILLHFTKKGIVALPIHDSFIVQRMHREELIETMKKVAYDMFEQELKVKEDPTAYDTHIEIYKRFLLPEHLPSSVEEYEKMYMTRSDYSKYVTRKEAWKATHPTPS